MTEQDQNPRPDDDAMGHIRRDADDAQGDDDAMGHIRRRSEIKVPITVRIPEVRKPRLIGAMAERSRSVARTV